MIRKLFVFIIAAVLFCSVGISCPSYGKAVQEFYDDFESGGTFWDFGSTPTMRILNGELISDCKESVCSARLRRETAKWQDFTMNTEFRLNADIGWFGVYVRTETDAEIRLIIHKNGFYTLPEPVGANGALCEIEDDKKYGLEMTADGTMLAVTIRDGNENIASWSGEYENAAAGGIGFGSYMAKAYIDSVRIVNEPHSPVYFKNKIVKLRQGGSTVILPENNTGKEADSVSYICGSEGFSAEQNGRITALESGENCAAVTAEVKIGNNTYTAQFDVIKEIPTVRLIGEEFSKMTVGDTKNTAVYFAPENASNKELVWETDNPEAVGIVGDTELSRGIRALAPAKNVRITAKSKENGEIYVDKYITIEGKPSEIKAEKFVPGEKKREIPYGMLGMSVSYEMSALNGGTDAETIRQYEKENIPYWHEMKIRQFRKCFDNYDFVNGKADGQNGGGYMLSDVFYAANELDIPINISLNSYYDSAEKITALVRELKKVTDKEICLDIWGEVYDGRMKNHTAWPVNSAKDYTDFLKEIYPEIRSEYPDGSVKIGATILDYASYLGFGNGVGTPTSNMCSDWNHRVAEAKDYYDALVVHHYSGSILKSAATKDIMENFAFSAYNIADGIEKQKEMFGKKEFWINEWGDLPFSLVFSDDTESTRGRVQYMKSLGNALGYLQRQCMMTLTENVTMSAYHLYNDSMGFGTIQGNGENAVKLPSYYMFSMLGDVFEKNDFIYELKPPQDEDLLYKKDLSGIYNTEYKPEVSLVNSWGFGSESEINEAIFENASEYTVRAYIPNKSLKKIWQYGNGENPLPDYAVSGERITDLPSEIPMPETFENEEFSDYLEIPPYTAVRAEVCERNTSTIWETAFEDDFSSGDLSKWHGGEEFENINGAMAVNVFNRTIYPNGVGASENISISFDFKDYMDHFFVKFYDEEDETDCFYVNCKSNKVWDVSQVTDLMHAGPEYWHNFGKGMPPEGVKSVKYTLTDGVITQYIKLAEEAEFSETGTYSWERENSYLKKGKKYAVAFYCIGQESSAEGYNKAKAAVDNVVVEYGKCDTQRVTGTAKILPVIKTVFKDDFSANLEKWSGDTQYCSITEDGKLSIYGFNKIISPQCDVYSETLSVQYDIYGAPTSMYLEFFNPEDGTDKFRIVSHEPQNWNVSQVTDFKDTWHNFGEGVTKDKWQTVRFVLNDGFIDMYKKDSEEPYFTERDHKGIPYLYNLPHGKTSLLKKNTKYGVRIYMYVNGEPVLIDNFRIEAVDTKTDAEAYGGEFTAENTEIYVKTDSGYELSSMPVAGAHNKIKVKMSGNAAGKVIFAAYGGEKLLCANCAETANISEIEADIPAEASKFKIMILNDIGSPLMNVIEY